MHEQKTAATKRKWVTTGSVRHQRKTNFNQKNSWSTCSKQWGRNKNCTQEHLIFHKELPLKYNKLYNDEYSLFNNGTSWYMYSLNFKKKHY